MQHNFGQEIWFVGLFIDIFLVKLKHVKLTGNSKFQALNFDSDLSKSQSDYIVQNTTQQQKYPTQLKTSGWSFRSSACEKCCSQVLLPPH